MTDQDEKICEKHIPKTTENFINFYNKLQAATKVNPGDVVVLVGSDVKKTKKKAYGVVERYKVDYTHPSGLVVARRILPDGKFGRSGIVNDGWWSVELDEQYIESLIMDAEETFDASADIKRLEQEKRKVTRYNKSISKKINTVAEAEEFVLSLKKGKVFWKGDNYMHLSHCKYEVIKDSFKTQENSWALSKREVYKVEMQRTTPWSTDSSSYIYTWRLEDLVGSVVATEEPLKVETTE